MNTDGLTGTYTESGTWYATTGERGPLSGRVTVERHGAGITFRYGDGREHGTAMKPEPGSHARLAGTAGDGMLYLGADAAVLEYRADINGRPEQNTDTWTLTGGVLRRAGVIRQPARVIWYEAVMARTQ
jgi:hypothetical protein